MIAISASRCLWFMGALASRHFRAVLSTVAVTLIASASTVSAHPHVFVVSTATINIDHSAITSISHTWTFDEMYTAMAVEGIGKNKDGGYGRAELAELAKVNIDGLKEFDYFTFAHVGKTALKILEPAADYYLDYTDNVLSLHFTVPLEKPVPVADAKDFTVTVTDPSYFIAFDMSEKDPPKLNADAPKSCSLTVAEPKDETADANANSNEKALAGAFSQQMAQVPMSMGGIVKSMIVNCTGG